VIVGGRGQFEALSQHLSGGTATNREKPYSE